MRSLRMRMYEQGQREPLFCLFFGSLRLLQLFPLQFTDYNKKNLSEDEILLFWRNGVKKLAEPLPK